MISIGICVVVVAMLFVGWYVINKDEDQIVDIWGLRKETFTNE